MRYLRYFTALTLYLDVPMMSSKYSSIPVSCSFCPLGFIIAICSTSPYEIINVCCNKTHQTQCLAYLKNKKSVMI